MSKFVLFVALVFHFIHVSLGQVTFNTSYEAANGTILVSNANIECVAFASCTNSIEPGITTNQTILCSGSYSCYNAAKIYASYSNVTKSIAQNLRIECSGLYFCARVTNMQTSGPLVFCYGELSCFGTTMNTNTYNMLK